MGGKRFDVTALLIPRQQSIKLPLFPRPVILRHFSGLAHQGFDEAALVLVGNGVHANTSPRRQLFV